MSYDRSEVFNEEEILEIEPDLPPEIDESLPERTDGKCTNKDCTIKCHEIDEENLSEDISSLFLEVKQILITVNRCN